MTWTQALVIIASLCAAMLVQRVVIARKLRRITGEKISLITGRRIEQ